MEKRRRAWKVLLPAGGVLIAGALLWWALAVPALVKYPTDLDARPRFAGTFTLYVDPATAAPLATPQQVPLSVTRHVQAVGKQSGASRVVVKETIVQKAGDLVDTTQTNVYVMDRKTLANVADPRAYAFTPSNVADRSKAYRLNLPFNTKRDHTYRIWKNEIGATYALRGDTAKPTTRENGLSLSNFSTSVTEVPVTDAYLAELGKSVPLPTSMTFDQLKPQLAKAGLDVDKLLAALTPVMTPEDLGKLVELSGKPIPLHYVLSFEGHTAVEPTTGAEVDISAKESLGARPQLTDLPALQAILGHYPQVPEAVAAGTVLTGLSKAPATKLFEYSYTQTRASVADIAKKVKSMRTQILFVRLYLPSALLVFGLGAIAFAIVRRPRRGTQPHAAFDARTKLSHA